MNKSFYLEKKIKKKNIRWEGWILNKIIIRLYKFNIRFMNECKSHPLILKSLPLETIHVIESTYIYFGIETV